MRSGKSGMRIKEVQMDMWDKLTIILQDFKNKKKDYWETIHAIKAEFAKRIGCVTFEEHLDAMKRLEKDIQDKNK